MDFTVELSKSYNVLPFEILKQDKDEVIMLINYFIEKGETSSSETTNIQQKKQGNGKNQRIRVNDKTASGGWF